MADTLARQQAEQIAHGKCPQINHGQVCSGEGEDFALCTHCEYIADAIEAALLAHAASAWAIRSPPVAPRSALETPPHEPDR